jgi:C4-dicarboxylate-specific signal transduction histidine kinase
LGELSAALTHEINNPLGVILGRTEMLLELTRDPHQTNWNQVRQMLLSIESTARRIEKIMQTVRSLAHKSDSEEIQKVTVQSLLDSVLDILGARLRRHDVKFEVKVESPSMSLECRPTEIFQILANLLSNAIDAVREQKERWVRLEVSKKDLGIHFCMIDSGPGVLEEIQKKLFTPFFTTKGVGVGTGLGLTISQSLAHRNRGRLYFEGNSPTRFCLWLPIDYNVAS